MSMKLLERLLFAQGQRCFFCNKVLQEGEGNVEHLIAKSRGGNNEEENCVACCKSLNSLFADRSVKAKMEILLRQRGEFRCPQEAARVEATAAPVAPKAVSFSAQQLTLVMSDLEKRGDSRPRTLDRLLNSVAARLQNQLDRKAVRSLVERLCAEGVVLLEKNDTVTYPLLARSADSRRKVPAVVEPLQRTVATR